MQTIWRTSARHAAQFCETRDVKETRVAEAVGSNKLMDSNTSNDKGKHNRNNESSNDRNHDRNHDNETKEQANPTPTTNQKKTIKNSNSSNITTITIIAMIDTATITNGLLTLRSTAMVILT